MTKMSRFAWLLWTRCQTTSEELLRLQSTVPHFFHSLLTLTLSAVTSGPSIFFNHFMVRSCGNKMDFHMCNSECFMAGIYLLDSNSEMSTSPTKLATFFSQCFRNVESQVCKSSQIWEIVTLENLVTEIARSFWMLSALAKNLALLWVPKCIPLKCGLKHTCWEICIMTLHYSLNMSQTHLCCHEHSY